MLHKDISIRFFLISLNAKRYEACIVLLCNFFLYFFHFYLPLSFFLFCRLSVNAYGAHLSKNLGYKQTSLMWYRLSSQQTNRSNPKP